MVIKSRLLILLLEYENIIYNRTIIQKDIYIILCNNDKKKN